MEGLEYTELIFKNNLNLLVFDFWGHGLNKESCSLGFDESQDTYYLIKYIIEKYG